jgi:hypothetical protein
VPVGICELHNSNRNSCKQVPVVVTTGAPNARRYGRLVSGTTAIARHKFTTAAVVHWYLDWVQTTCEVCFQC